MVDNSHPCLQDGRSLLPMLEVGLDHDTASVASKCLYPLSISGFSWFFVFPICHLSSLPIWPVKILPITWKNPFVLSLLGHWEVAQHLMQCICWPVPRWLTCSYSKNAAVTLPSCHR